MTCEQREQEARALWEKHKDAYLAEIAFGPVYQKKGWAITWMILGMKLAEKRLEAERETPRLVNRL